MTGDLLQSENGESGESGEILTVKLEGIKEKKWLGCESTARTERESE